MMMFDNKYAKIEPNEDGSLKKCFILMPIADPPDYDKDHFLRVYDNLIQPACKLAGFEPELASAPSGSHDIVLKILQSLVKYDMALCDLSSANPNVLYELGIRQMAKMPVALIKDEKTRKIFDIDSIRYTPYNSSLRVDQVKDAIAKISDSLLESYRDREKITADFLSKLSIDLQVKSEVVQITQGEYIILDQIKALKNSINSIDHFSDRKSTTNLIWDGSGKKIVPGSILNFTQNTIGDNERIAIFFLALAITFTGDSTREGTLSLLNLKDYKIDEYYFDFRITDLFISDELTLKEYHPDQYNNLLKYRKNLGNLPLNL